jgi:hypothetical protein
MPSAKESAPRTLTCRQCAGIFIAAPNGSRLCSVECRVRFRAAQFTDPDACWFWSDTCAAADRYGMLTDRQTGERHYAHRVSLSVFGRPLADDQFALHQCDHRACFNPNHLFAGTALDNTRDMLRKGRHYRQVNATPRREKAYPDRRLSHGVGHHNARLNEMAVRDIRQSAEALAVVAARHGVSTTTASKVRRGEMWAHVKPQDTGEAGESRSK